MVIQKSELLCAQGDLADRMFIVKRGRLRTLEGGETLAELGPGECLGERLLLDPAPCTFSVQALEETELCVIDKDTFQESLEAQPEWMYRLVHALAGREKKQRQEQEARRLCQCFPSLLWSLLCAEEESPEGITLEDLGHRVSALCGLDSAGLRALLEFCCDLSLSEWKGEGEGQRLWLRSPPMLERLYEALYRQEREKPAPDWVLSAGEQRILSCWLEAARGFARQKEGKTAVPYGYFLEVLKKHTPGATLGVAALSRMEKAGLLSQHGPSDELLGNCQAAQEALEGSHLLARIHAELPRLRENF